MKQVITLCLLCWVTCLSAQYKPRILPPALSFVAGATWGLHETLVHHNSKFFNVFPNASQSYWGPNSWENKYKDPWWVPVQLSDGKHLTATTHHGLVFGVGLTVVIGEKRPFKHYMYDAGISLVSYSLGNWLVYDQLFK